MFSDIGVIVCIISSHICDVIPGNLQANKSQLAETSSGMSFKGKSIDTLYEKIKSMVDLSNEYEGVSIKIVSDIDSGTIKIYDQDVDIIKRASYGLHELLELSYSSAEHHPYWAILYNATEILKMILDKWDSDLSKDEIDNMSWRIDEIRRTLHKIEPA